MREESFDSIWPDCDVLGQNHFKEVEFGVDSRRQFALDTLQLSLLSERGILRVISGRTLQGELRGYLTWNVGSDPESRGLLIAVQGAFYVVPGNAKLGLMMWEESIEVLRRLAVNCVFPNHRLEGRGKTLGKFFRRQGAKLIKHEYMLWIGK